MGVAPTGAIFRGLTFGGASSKDYGIYITGTGVYNAPERDVEMITIPGRNGDLVLDNGRFSNIEVTYHCGVFGDSQANFAEAVSEFRNLLCSRLGYMRLTDDYNLNEYRMAVYKNGLDVTADAVRAGEFDITFDCKPQRFLTSGETTITVTSGDEITNPTLFPASPMLMLDGVGDVNIGDYTITVNDVPFGWIVVNNGWSDVVTTGRIAQKTYNIDTANLNAGDQIQVGDTGQLAGGSLHAICIHPQLEFDNLTTTYGTRDFDFGAYAERDGTNAEVKMSFTNVTFNYGTHASKSASVTFVFKRGSTTIATIQERVTFEYYGSDRIDITVQSDSSTNSTVLVGSKTLANSTVSSLSGTTYVDMEIAEAYVMTASGPESANDHVIIGSDVPVLVPGANEITFDNTITSLQIIPRWWKI